MKEHLETIMWSDFELIKLVRHCFKVSSVLWLVLPCSTSWHSETTQTDESAFRIWAKNGHEIVKIKRLKVEKVAFGTGRSGRSNVEQWAIKLTSEFHYSPPYNNLCTNWYNVRMRSRLGRSARTVSYPIAGTGENIFCWGGRIAKAVLMPIHSTLRICCNLRQTVTLQINRKFSNYYEM